MWSSAWPSLGASAGTWADVNVGPEPRVNTKQAQPMKNEATTVSTAADASLAAAGIWCELPDRR